MTPNEPYELEDDASKPQTEKGLHAMPFVLDPKSLDESFRASIFDGAAGQVVTALDVSLAVDEHMDKAGVSNSRSLEFSGRIIPIVSARLDVLHRTMAREGDAEKRSAIVAKQEEVIAKAIFSVALSLLQTVTDRAISMLAGAITTGREKDYAYVEALMSLVK